MILEVTGVRFRYDSTDVLEDVTFSLAAGEITGIVGPNASGKSTLLKCMSGIIKPYTGDVLVEKKSLKRLRPKEVAKVIACVPQTDDTHVPMTVFETVLVGRKPHAGWAPSRKDTDRASLTMEKLGICPIAMRNINSISGGQRRKAFIGRALAQEGCVLLLDEPTASLDIRHAIEVLEIIRDQAAGGLAVAMSIHDLNLASRYCDKIIILSEGKIHAAGGIEVLTRENIRAVYGIDAKVIRDQDAGTIVVPLSPGARVGRDTN